MKTSRVGCALSFVIIYYWICSMPFLNASSDKKNVCTDWKYYYTDRKSHCYNNPTAYYDVDDIIKYYGYPVEKYNVTTEDGYVLTIFRIPNEDKPPIFIEHGFRLNSAVFVDIGVNSLAYVLWSNGYDIWLGNLRGSAYSTHTYLNKSDEKFWDFSFHEMGIYDTRASIDLVLEKTGQKIFFIGYSMGTTNYFIFSSMFPELANESIRAAVLMAPIGYVYHLKTPERFLTVDGIYQILEFILFTFTGGAVSIRTPEFLKMREVTCLPYPFQMQFCSITSSLLGGYDRSQQNPETLPIILMQHIDAASVKTINHFAQLVRNKNFACYDYGEEKNKQVYGTTKPPPYNLSNIIVPNLFIWANGDLLATDENTEETVSRIRSSNVLGVHKVPYDQFSHGDFVEAKEAKELVYDYIVEFLSVNGSDYQ